MINRSFLTAIALVAVAIVATSSRAETRTIDVPADFARLVPADAGVVAYISDLGELQSSWLEMLPKAVRGEKSVMMPDLRTELIKTSGKMDADASILVWIGDLAELLPTATTGVLHVAFRVPGGTSDNTSLIPGDPGWELVVADGMAIATHNLQDTKTPPPYTMPKQAGNPLLKDIPEGLVSWAVRGSDLGEVAKGVAPMASMAPMMLQSTLAERTQKMSAEDRKAVSKAQQGLLRDISNLIGSAVSALEDVTLMTGSVGIEGDGMTLHTHFSIGGEVAADHGVDSRLISQMPDGSALYAAFDAPTVKWIADFEIDVLEALFANNAASVAKFDSMMSEVKSAGTLIDGGYVLSMSDTSEVYTLIGCDQPKKLIAATEKIFDSMNAAEMGMTYTSTGKNAWDFQIDSTKMMSTLGMPEASGAAGGTPAGWSVTMTAGDQMVVIDQSPIENKAAQKPRKPQKSDTRAVFDKMKDTKIIFGISFDFMMLGEAAAASMDLKDPPVPQVMRDMKTDVNVVLHSPDPKTVSLHLQMPMGVILGGPMMDAVK